MRKINQAVILCAGLGTRLRPLTDNMPKPMVPILGKPMLLWNIEQFKKYGVINFKINLYHLPDVIKNYFGDGSKFGVKIEYSFEKEILGTAGALGEFDKKLDDFFFLIYGDVVSFIDYNKMAVKFFGLEKPIGMQRVGLTSNYGDANVAELDHNNKFVTVYIKPHSEIYSNAYRMRGSFIFSKKVLNYIEKGKCSEISKNLLPKLIENDENFYGYECDEFSKGVDTIDKLNEVEDYIRNNHMII
ncbi:MAG: nucleotidyltransferase family protein [Patescibacteria group bacterium]|nr:nucleotidyltransferase family protein [Patescibacteria group bacterium]